jgi:histidine triad (HIT) family protein
MGQYLTSAEVVTRLGTKRAYELTTETGTTPDTDIIDDVIDEAEGEANSYFARRYATPVDVSAHADAVAALRKKGEGVSAVVKVAPEDAMGINTRLGLARVARAVKTALQPDGLNVFQANGVAAGQTVFHLHFHILPRFVDDHFTIQFHGNPTSNREHLATIARRIEQALP